MYSTTSNAYRVLSHLLLSNDGTISTGVHNAYVEPLQSHPQPLNVLRRTRTIVPILGLLGQSELTDARTITILVASFALCGSKPTIFFFQRNLHVAFFRDLQDKTDVSQCDFSNEPESIICVCIFGPWPCQWFPLEGISE